MSSKCQKINADVLHTISAIPLFPVRCLINAKKIPEMKQIGDQI